MTRFARVGGSLTANAGSASAEMGDRVWAALSLRKSTLSLGGALPHDCVWPHVVQTSRLWSRPYALLDGRSRSCAAPFTLRVARMPPQVIFREPRAINAIFAAPETSLMPGKGGDTVAPIVGSRSFMLADDEAHRVGRKASVAAFNVKAVEQHAAMVGGAAQRALAAWPEGVAVAMHGHLRALTLEVILRTLTSHLDGELDITLASLHHEVLAMLTITASPMFVETRLRHGPGKVVWTRFLDRRRRVFELLSALIRSGRLRSLRGCASADPGYDDAETTSDDIMSLILAGHETTAAQLAWAFQLLAHHPNVRDRLLREIDSESGDEYLTATIQEVLRHRSVFVFATPRVVAEPFEIDDWAFAPPTNLLACIYLLHHDAATYSDPEVFRPERFLGAPPEPSTWIPWGGGRKRCPGLHLAMLEMKVVLRTVLRARRPEPAARRMERPRWRSVIVVPHAGSRVVLVKRR